MKRSFKAASVFAGMGAMAGVFAPAALAAPVHGADAAQPGIGPWRECGANNGGVSNWVHFYYPNDDHPAECIGGSGSTAANATIYSFCPGNNVGAVFGTEDFAYNFTDTPRGRHPVTVYDSGKAKEVHATGLWITGWLGHSTC